MGGKFEETPYVTNVTNILLNFGYDDPACDVYRFWDHDLPVRISAIANSTTTNTTLVLPLLIRCPTKPPEDCRPHCPGRVLCFFGSFGPGGVVNFQLNRTALGLPADAAAADAEFIQTGGSVNRVAGGSGNFTFRLDEHSYRIVVVE